MNNFTPLLSRLFVSIPTDVTNNPKMDLVSFLSSNVLTIYRSLSLQKLFTVTSRKLSHVTTASFSPCGREIAVGYDDGVVAIISVESSEVVQTIDGSSSSASISHLNWSAKETSSSSFSSSSSSTFDDLHGLGFGSSTNPHQFLPFDCHANSHLEDPDPDPDPAISSNSDSPFPTTPFSLLRVVDENLCVSVFLSGRYKLMGGHDAFQTQNKSRPTKIVACLASGGGGASASSLSLLTNSSCQETTLVTIRSPHFSTAGGKHTLTILAEKKHVLNGFLSSLERGLNKSEATWSTTFRPLDSKLALLTQLFKDYGVESGVDIISVKAELLKLIVEKSPLSLARKGEGGSADSAMSQFFASSLTDQAVGRLVKTSEQGISNCEELLRSGAVNASISLTYISSELVGLCRASVSSENKFLYSLVTANSLLSTSQQLYLAIELLVKELVITRARLRSFLAWIIMVMADLKAFGTSSDAPERTAANGRKVSGETLKSVVSFLGETTPTTTTISDIESLLNVRFNTLLCNVKNLLQKSKMLMNQLFDEPLNRIAGFVETETSTFIDVDFDSMVSHTRDGSNFSPNSVLSENWTLFAFNNESNKLRLGATPQGLQTLWAGVHLGPAEEVRIKSVKFYSNGDGKNEEKREKIGMVVWCGGQEELWMLEYGKLLWCEDQSDVSMFSRCRFVVGDEEEDEGGGEGVEVRKRVLRELHEDATATELYLDGNRGVAITVCGDTECVTVFDLEEHEEADDEDEEENESGEDDV